MLRRSPIAFVMTVLLASLLLSTWAEAKVVRVDIESRSRVFQGHSFGRSGPYEQLKGKIYLEVDPDHAANQSIVDLDLAERNERGMVEFATDFELQTPVEPARGNHRLIYFVNNRALRPKTAIQLPLTTRQRRL